jgi:cytochrome c oxidase subunit 2
MKLPWQAALVLLASGVLAYWAWSRREQVNEPRPPQTAAARGLAFASATGCTACHSLDGTRGIGPSWAGSFGTTRRFKDGGSAVVDAEYLRRSMLDPAAQVVESFENIMLPVAMTEAQIADIIALITDLESKATQ